MTSYIEAQTLTIDTLDQLDQAARQFSRQLQPGDVVALQGDLGAGKTTFSQRLLKHCGVTDVVKSPTYTLYETYRVNEQGYVHMDLYRLTDPEELFFMGIEDLLDGRQIVLVEWPDKGRGVLPDAKWILSFQLNGLNRTLTTTSNS
jgi:tRNA threonylcarbamoyladenosine biosynthesis protein TsaE